MDRKLRTILQHPIQLLLLILLPIAIGGIVAYSLPHQYQATAMLWALHRYDTLTATAVDNTNLATPAETQVTALSELLQTRSFSLAVAQEAHLAETLKAQVRDNPQTRDDALVSDIAQYVQVQTLGYDLFTITYTNTHPQIAQQVVAAVIDNYGQQSQQTVAPEEQNLLKTYQTNVSLAQQYAQNAVAAEAQYTESHPKLTQLDLEHDPQYQQLHAQTQQRQLNLQYVEATLNALEQTITTHRVIATSLYKVLDPPSAPKPVSRLKALLLGIGMGLAVAIVASALFIALAVRRDRGVYTSSDLQKVTSYPVVMELPCLSPKTMSILVKTWEQPDPLANDGRS